MFFVLALLQYCTCWNEVMHILVSFFSFFLFLSSFLFPSLLSSFILIYTEFLFPPLLANRISLSVLLFHMHLSALQLSKTLQSLFLLLFHCKFMLVNKNLMQSSCDIRRRQWHPTPVLLPGKSHGWRSLVGCSPWGHKESDRTERLHFHFSLSCIGEGNGNPLQCSCLENPRDGGAWWAAVYGVAQSWTRLKQLSSSSSSRPHLHLLKL